MTVFDRARHGKIGTPLVGDHVSLPRLFDLRSKRAVSAQVLVGSCHVNAQTLRSAVKDGLRAGLPIILCRDCLGVVDLIYRAKRGLYYFRHAPGVPPCQEHRAAFRSETTDRSFKHWLMNCWMCRASKYQGEHARIRQREMERALTVRGIAHDLRPVKNGGCADLISALTSAKVGQPIEYTFRYNIQIAYYLEGRAQHFLFPFLVALDLYGSRAALEAQDTTGAWRKKEVAYLRAKRARGYVERDRQFDELVGLLFPEILPLLDDLWAVSTQT